VPVAGTVPETGPVTESETGSVAVAEPETGPETNELRLCMIVPSRSDGTRPLAAFPYSHLFGRFGVAVRVRTTAIPVKQAEQMS